VVLAAAYLLWLYQRVFFGPVTNPKNEKLADLSPREVLTFAPLIALALFIGIYPKPFFQILQQPVQQLVQTVRPGEGQPVLATKPAVNSAPSTTVIPSGATPSMSVIPSEATRSGAKGSAVEGPLRVQSPRASQQAFQPATSKEAPIASSKTTAVAAVR
jgi:hypothetical protein